jgi:beta-lactamase regulating signal transducer with metallopeptidase domain
VEPLLQLGLSNALVATGLAVLAAGFTWWCRRPAVSHCLWLLVLLKLITPPFWPVQLSWFPAFESSIAENPQPVPGTSSEQAPLLDEALQAEIIIAEVTPVLDENQAAEPARTKSLLASVSWQQMALTVWLAGTAAWFLVAGWRICQFRRLLRFARPASPELQKQVQQLAGQLGLTRCPGGWLLPGPLSPMLWAVGGRARLLIPGALFEQLGEDHRATLLVHELAHLRRRDHWVRWLEFVVTGLYWWHPVVWWARREIGIAEEECCDSWVVGTLPAAARAYAQALVETVDFLSEVRCALPPAVSGIGHVQLLRRRLGMIMLGTSPQKMSAPGLLVVLALALVVLPWAPTWAQSGSERKQSDDRKADSPRTDERHVIVIRPEGSGDDIEVIATPTAELKDNEASAAVEDIRDQVELAKAQVDIKRAEMTEGEARTAQAQRRLTKIKKLGNAVSEDEIAKAQEDLELAQAQLGQKKAQLREAELRVHQAERRLAKLQPAKKGSNQTDPRRRVYHLAVPAGDTPADAKARVKDVEEKINKALKGLDAENKQRVEVEVKRAQDAVRKAMEAKRALEQTELPKAATDRARAAVEKATTKIEEKTRAAVEKAKAADETAKRRPTAIEVIRPADTKSVDDAIKALEQKLEKLTREMESIRSDIRALAPAGDRPSTTPRPRPR